MGSTWAPQKMLPVNRLYYIHGGTGWYQTGTEIHKFEKGRLYFLPRNAVYTLSASDDDPLNHTFIDLQSTPVLTSKRIVSVQPDENGILEAACSTFLCCAAHIRANRLPSDSFFDSKPLYNMLTASVVYILGYLIDKNDLGLSKDTLIVAVANDIYKNFSGNITVTGLAKKYNISVNKLIEKFRQHIGTTPRALIKQLKLDAARALLKEGKTLGVAAAAVGYSDSTSLKHALTAGKQK